MANIPNNEIHYTSSNGKIVTPANSNFSGVTIVSNIYENGVGIITFDGNVTSIGDWAFYECRSLISITIPQVLEIVLSLIVEVLLQPQYQTQ